MVPQGLSFPQNLGPDHKTSTHITIALHQGIMSVDARSRCNRLDDHHCQMKRAQQTSDAASKGVE
eukprot:313772-Rhodomonas_salina.1